MGGKGKEEEDGKRAEGLQPPETSIPGAATADLDPHFVNPGSAPGEASERRVMGVTKIGLSAERQNSRSRSVHTLRRQSAINVEGGGGMLSTAHSSTFS